MTDQNDDDRMPDIMHQFTLDLIKDLKDLRRGKITLAEGRVRMGLAREVIRSVYAQIDGAKLQMARANEIKNIVDQSGGGD